jgi:hypothetical protein
MNEKIKQLAKQSKLWDNLDPRTLGICDSTTENVWGEELQEFAELIVMECADWVKSRTMSNELKEGLKQHFGVKE